MIFLIPFASYIFIYLAAALLPAFFLMRYIYRKDQWEPEPLSLLLYLAFLGVVAALLSVILEGIASALLSLSSIRPDSPLYAIITAFFGVAAIEEGTKYYLVYRRTWEDANFNFRFDAIVYSAFVSLGFAAFENVYYVFTYGLSVAFPRAILAIPGHLAFSVVFGYFYGRARAQADHGEMPRARASLLAGYVLATLLHGFYDACTMIGTDRSLLAFLIFVAVMYIVILRIIRQEALNDKPLF